MTNDQIKVLLIFGAFGLGLMYLAFRKMRLRRKISDTPRSKIASAPQGYIEVQGFAWPVEASSTLFSGKEVVYYSLQLQRKETRGSGKNKRTEWVTVFRRVDAHPFYVVDETGLALVNIQDASLELDSSITRNWRSVPTSEKERIVGLVGGQVSGFPPGTSFFGLFGGTYQIIENEIFVGSPLYLHGDFSSSIAPDGNTVRPKGLGEFCSRVFHMAGRTQKNVKHLLDKNKDGKVSHTEAQEGYSLVGAMARRREDSQNDADFIVYGEMGSSKQHKLVLADAHEAHLVSRLNNYVFWPFLGGAICLTIAIAQFFDLNFDSWRSNTNHFAEAETTAVEPRPKSRVRQTHSASASDVSQQHVACQNGTRTACIDLLERKAELQLTETYIRYYSKRACELGQSQYCTTD